MSTQVNNNPEHDEIISMLPWFINRSLEGSKRIKVSQHIETCEHCQQEIEVLTALSKAVNSDAQNRYNHDANIEKDLTSVMSRIDTQSRQTATITSVLKQKLDEAMSYFISHSGLQWSATALACLLVTVLGFQFFNPQPINDYSVLSSSDNVDSPIQLAIEVSPAVEMEQARAKIQTELEEIGHQIDIEAVTDNALVIGIESSIAVSELRNIINQLENKAHINRVEIIPYTDQ